ncbi:SDR family oxidoreductase [Gammaproteobacteria bacterium]|nr:SDR family oxidoreductase [Gammaproteobacteria bacterium]
MDENLNNRKVVLITGATRGIGKAIAAEFAVLGYDLILTGTNLQQIEALNQKCNQHIHYVAVDFSDTSSSDSFFKYLQSLPRLNICINCAGINIIKPIDSVSDSDLDRIIAINYTSIYRTCRVVSSIMRNQGGGHIVNIASIWSVISKAHRTLYSGTKTALIGLTRALAAELGPDKILVNCLSPGFVLTDMTRQSLTPGELKNLEMQVPLQRCAQPEEIAKAAAFLAGSNNTYLTGQNIVIDGGFSIV